MCMHDCTLFKSSRWPKKLPRKSEDIIEARTNMVLEQRQYVSRIRFKAQICRTRFRQNTHEFHFFSPDLAPGGSDDWAYNLGIKYSFTFELQDRGRYGFLLPPSHISQACNEALTAVKTIALKVIEKTQAPTGPPHTV